MDDNVYDPDDNADPLLGVLQILTQWPSLTWTPEAVRRGAGPESGTEATMGLDHGEMEHACNDPEECAEAGARPASLARRMARRVIAVRGAAGVPRRSVPEARETRAMALAKHEKEQSGRWRKW